MRSSITSLDYQDEVTENIMKITSFLNSNYGSMKIEASSRAKKLVELNKKSDQTFKNQEIQKIFSSLNKTISRIQAKAIGDFKRFSENVANKNDLKLLSNEELLAKSIDCTCLLIKHNDLDEEFRKDELAMGLIVECDWYLNENQSLFIRHNFHKDATMSNESGEFILDQVFFLCFTFYSKTHCLLNY